MMPEDAIIMSLCCYDDEDQKRPLSELERPYRKDIHQSINVSNNNNHANITLKGTFNLFFSMFLPLPSSQLLETYFHTLNKLPVGVHYSMDGH